MTRNFVGCDSTSTQWQIRARRWHRCTGSGDYLVEHYLRQYCRCISGLAGGGISARNNLYLTDTNVTDNVLLGASYTRHGGGIAVNGYAATKLLRTTVSGNSSAQGGGIYAGGNQTVSISDSTISGNSASDAAGGIMLNGFYLQVPYSAYPLELTNSTVTANVSTGGRGGGGIVDIHVPLLGVSDFESSIVAGNSNTMAGATYDADLATSTSNITGAHNLIVAASNVQLPPDTLQVDPLLGPLQDNGGLTPTHALLEGSPAIDAGNNINSLEFDQRGSGFPRVSGGAADIGAFEFQQPTSAPTVAKSFLPNTITVGTSSVPDDHADKRQRRRGDVARRPLRYVSPRMSSSRVRAMQKPHALAMCLPRSVAVR